MVFAASSQESSVTGSPISSPAPSPSPTSDARTLILGMVLGIVGVLFIGGIIYMTIRFKRREPLPHHGSANVPSHGTEVNRNHLASRITPFGSPRFSFAHTPGANMRIAKRRSDGVWEFSDPQVPFKPAGVNDLDLVPPSPSSSHTILHSPRSINFPKKLTKDQEARMGWEQSRRGNDVETDDYDAPPAYVFENKP